MQKQPRSDMHGKWEIKKKRGYMYAGATNVFDR
jgi:hypothetical protein